jgi:hypothetical protein
MPFCDTTNHSLSLPTIGIQFPNKTIARTGNVIIGSVMISSNEQICGLRFTMAQHNRKHSKARIL